MLKVWWSLMAVLFCKLLNTTNYTYKLNGLIQKQSGPMMDISTRDRRQKMCYTVCNHGPRYNLCHVIGSRSTSANNFVFVFFLNFSLSKLMK